ncbi:MAG: hypothetical protein EOP84_35535, partial [Verrucomicrobiaceae bacterium]
MRGIGRYVLEFVRALKEELNDLELLISFNGQLRDEAISAREVVRGLIDKPNIHIWHGVADTGESVGGYTQRRRLSEAALLHHVACLGVDLALSTSPFEGFGDTAVPLLPAQNSFVPTACIFYDAIPWRFKERYLPGKNAVESYRRRIGTLQHSSLNLCISEFSKSESRDLWPTVPAVNIMAGVSPEFLSYLGRDPTQDMRVASRPFALYVGGLDWRKNVATIVDAFRLFPQSLKTTACLALAGDHPKPLLDELCDRWRSVGLPDDQLVLLGHVSDER